jgi:hypothetical protein
VAELTRLLGESTAAFAAILTRALRYLPNAPIEPTGTHIRWR